jgi:hypothetical protein
MLWRDIVAIVDDGRRSAPSYRGLGKLTESLKREYPGGYGVLIIIPRNARPPSDEARRAINDALASAEGGLKCVCWLVEGKGFQAAMARAVLTGLRFFPRATFDTAVKSDLRDALEWILTCLRGPDVLVGKDVAAASKCIATLRPVPS